MKVRTHTWARMWAQVRAQVRRRVHPVAASWGLVREGDRGPSLELRLSECVWFSVFTALCALATGPLSLGVLRLIAGIGLGAIVPAASALTMEYATPRHRTLAYTLMLSGVPMGGVISALVGIPVLPRFGWQAMFVIALAALAALPFVWRKLPESVVFLAARGRSGEAKALARRLGVAMPEAVGQSRREGGLFRRGYVRASILFAAATFCGLLAWFGLATWLPGIMRASGYDLGSSLVFLLVLNLGAIAGSVFIAMATDRWGSKLVVVLTYVGMAVALMALFIRLPQGPLLVAIAFAGVGGHGGQILINAYVGKSYPASHRASALGWTLGLGRIGTVVGPTLIGWIVSGQDGRLAFTVFAVTAVAAAVLLLFIPRTPVLEEPELVLQEPGNRNPVGTPTATTKNGSS